MIYFSIFGPKVLIISPLEQEHATTPQNLPKISILPAFNGIPHLFVVFPIIIVVLGTLLLATEILNPWSRWPQQEVVLLDNVKTQGNSLEKKAAAMSVTISSMKPEPTMLANLKSHHDF